MSGDLIDVTGGSATGIAQTDFIDSYSLLATFSNLSDPVGSDFYEGWVVRREPFVPEWLKKSTVYTLTRINII